MEKSNHKRRSGKTFNEAQLKTHGRNVEGEKNF